MMVSVMYVITISNMGYICIQHLHTWYKYHDGKCEVTLTRQYRYISVNNVQIASKNDLFNCE